MARAVITGRLKTLKKGIMAAASARLILAYGVISRGQRRSPVFIIGGTTRRYEILWQIAPYLNDGNTLSRLITVTTKNNKKKQRAHNERAALVDGYRSRSRMLREMLRVYLSNDGIIIKRSKIRRFQCWIRRSLMVSIFAGE